jgi:fumarate reductase flavoprotein subunit
MNKTISRRDLLKGAAAGAVGVAAVSVIGCSPSTSATTVSPAASTSAKPQVSETISTDLLIVGSGAAGIFAAYEAGKAKAGKVLVISNSTTSAATNGSMVSGTCAVESSYLKEIGQKFTTKELYDKMYDFSHHVVNGRLLRTCVDYMPENIDIFTEMGIKFTLGGDRYGDGFLNVHLFATDDKNTLMQAYEEKNFGVEFRFKTEAYQPVMNGKAVTGVYATDENGKTIQINAKAVIMACGGFIDNKDEMQEKFGVNVVRLATEWQTGKGISLAEQAGAFREGQNGLGLSDIIGANEKVGFTFENPLTMMALFGNLLVDPNGNRFTNEFSLANASMSYGGEALLHVKKYYAVYSQAVIDDLQTKGYYEHIGSPKCWPTGALVYSQPIPVMQKFIDEAIKNGWCWKSDTIQGLADVQSLTNLDATVKAYDAMIDAGVDNEFGKPIEMCDKIENSGPYYLIQYNPGAFNTFGGCRTDEFTHALNADFEIVPGLYIAGVENGSLYGRPYYDVGGTCSALAYSSGRIAGKQAAADLKSL